jgi:hypothetical protein
MKRREAPGCRKKGIGVEAFGGARDFLKDLLEMLDKGRGAVV